jgi:prepilin peptidase CpaA
MGIGQQLDVMHVHRLLPLAPLLALLLWAAIEDVRARRIPNWLTFSLILTGILQSFIGHRGITPAAAGLGPLVGFALPLTLFLLGAVGGGDVKLMAGVGAWLGPAAVFEVFCATALIGMVIVLTQAIIQGRLRVLSRNTAVLAINMVHLGDVGIQHVSATGKSCRSVDKPLPYAVPVLLAVTLLVCGLLP